MTMLLAVHNAESEMYNRKPLINTPLFLYINHQSGQTVVTVNIKLVLCTLFAFDYLLNIRDLNTHSLNFLNIFLNFMKCILKSPKNLNLQILTLKSTFFMKMNFLKH